MKMVRYLLAIFGLLALHGVGLCQQKNDTIPSFIKGKQAVGQRVTDSLPPKASLRSKGHTDSPYKVDSATRRKHDPRRATLYSTFLPGLGQVYNRKYWKVPLVAAAVGIPAYTFFYNKGWYKKCQAAIAISAEYEATGTPVPDDQLAKIDPKLRTFVQSGNANSLRSYRNEFRKDQDYSVIFFLLFWGLNIVDATVDAHLAGFDVSDQLSIRMAQPSGTMPGPGSMGGVTGFGLVVDYHKPKFRPLLVP